MSEYFESKENLQEAVRRSFNDVLKEKEAREAMQQKDNDDGYIYIESGTFDLTCEDKVLKSKGMITVTGGSFTVNGEEETFSVYRP